MWLAFGFYFLLGIKTFECTYVDPGRSIKTFEGLDEASRIGIIAAVHKLQLLELRNHKSKFIRINPKTDYFAVIAEPDFHRYDVKMLLPYSALTTQ